jgi:plastocyanin
MTRIRTFALVAALGSALAVTASAGAARPKLIGTVGPGFTILLTQKGKTVKKLRAGTYAITVIDKSNIHNFHLRGPGVNKEITQISFVGRKTVVLKLRKGIYRFVCDPHATLMKGRFRVL